MTKLNKRVLFFFVLVMIYYVESVFRDQILTYGDRGTSGSFEEGLNFFYFLLFTFLVEVLRLDILFCTAPIYYILVVLKREFKINIFLIVFQLLIFVGIMVVNYNKMIRLYNVKENYLSAKVVVPSQKFDIIDTNRSSLAGFLKYTYLLPMRLNSRRDLIGKQGDYGLDCYQADVNVKFYICFALFVSYLGFYFFKRDFYRLKIDKNGTE